VHLLPTLTRNQVIAEQSERVHFVNTITWQEQKEIVTKYGSLSGITFSHDGKTIYLGMCYIDRYIRRPKDNNNFYLYYSYLGGNIRMECDNHKFIEGYLSTIHPKAA